MDRPSSDRPSGERRSGSPREGRPQRSASGQPIPRAAARRRRDDGSEQPRPRRPRDTPAGDADRPRRSSARPRTDDAPRKTRRTDRPGPERPQKAAAPASAPATGAPPADGKKSARSITRIAVAVVSVAVLVATGYAWNQMTSLENSITKLDGLSLGSGKDGAVDILMVGTDSRTDAQGNPLSEKELAQLHSADDVGTNTDTILLIRIPNDGSSATAISIPRDSYVEVPGVGMTKINSAYGSAKEEKRAALVNEGMDLGEADKESVQAGRDAVINTVTGLTGVEVDHYAEIGLLGFVLLTNAVGGVDVCLNAAVDEPFSGADFPAGQQKLDGSQALSFVRQRHDLPRGDLDRIVRQQVFMASLAQKVLSAGTLTNPGKLSDLQNAVSRSVVIDQNWDVLKFVEQLKDLSGGRVQFATIPVVTEQGWSDDGTQSVVEVDPVAVKAFTQGLLGEKNADGTVAFLAGDYTVDVINTGTVDGLATNVSRIVANKGYRPGETGNDTNATVDSQVLAATTDDPGAIAVSKDLGGLPITADTSLPPNTVRVILTDSYTGPGSISDSGAQDSQESDTQETPTPPAPRITAGGTGPECVN
ncbi:UNVERIFIED_CONTAM: LytR family transcriptional attenuator [Williamsia faeni]